MFLDIEHQLGFTPKLNPETLTAIFDGTPDAILPKLAAHPHFNEAIKVLCAAEILKVEGRTTRLHAPDGEGHRVEIVQRARAWTVQKEPEIKYVSMTPEQSAVLQRQSDIDREEAGPQVPYDRLDNRGVSLQKVCAQVAAILLWDNACGDRRISKHN